MRRHAHVVSLLWGGAWGCSDYGLKGGAGEKLGSQDSAPQDSAPLQLEEEDSAPPAVLDCDEVVFPAWEWWGSPPFSAADDPQDTAGKYWYEVDFLQDGYSTVVIPDQNIPVGQDRVYRGRFVLATMPPNLSLNLQSDDGLRVYVNGTAVGQWGGAWQEEGCVNDEAGCGTTETVAPVDVTAWLVAGENVVAARVSNPVVSAYFSIAPECIEGR